MLDINKSKEILENYFAIVTHEQFAKDLEKYCPELVEAELANLEPDTSKNTELYQQAKQESKLSSTITSDIPNPLHPQSD